jgi:hypothetical protein
VTVTQPAVSIDQNVMSPDGRGSIAKTREKVSAEKLLVVAMEARSSPGIRLPSTVTWTSVCSVDLMDIYCGPIPSKNADAGGGIIS